jgi:tartrate-resistant acid phosphatase type 5
MPTPRALMFVALAAACTTEVRTPADTQASGGPLHPPEDTEAELIGELIGELPTGTRFAFIGDFGYLGEDQAQVAALVAAWDPAYIGTMGDNNYPSGGGDTIDENIGQFYAPWIGPYLGAYGPGSPDGNHFYPALGNHDWDTDDAGPHLAYFQLPGNERYYDVVRGDVHLIVVDSDSREPDGIEANSTQAAWVREVARTSPAAFQIVLLHHPPYSSGLHGDNEALQWPWAEWGIDLVVGGHDHVYERLQRHGITYLIDGRGGVYLYDIYDAEPGSVTAFDLDHGALLGDVSDGVLRIRAVTVGGVQLDEIALTAAPPTPAPVELLAPGSTVRWLQTDSPPEDWAATAFDDAEWAQGALPLGRRLHGAGTELPDTSRVVYARAVLDLAEPTAITVKIARDDGVIARLDGVEIFRHNLPLTGVEPTTPAAYEIEGAWSRRMAPHQVPGVVRAGRHVLAVELHQSAGSRDAWLDLSVESR